MKNMNLVVLFMVAISIAAMITAWQLQEVKGLLNLGSFGLLALYAIIIFTAYIIIKKLKGSAD